MYLRKHSAVDYAKIKMPETFLFPKKLSISNTLQLNVSLDGERLMLDGAEIPIFNSHGLNIEQKQAVVHALKVSYIYQLFDTFYQFRLFCMNKI